MLRQLDRDCEFLEAEGIMDYSFLIGLHFRDDSSVVEVKSLPDELCSGIYMSSYFLLVLHFISFELIGSTRVKKKSVGSVDLAGKRDMQNDDIQDMKWIPIDRYALYFSSTVSDCFCCFNMMNKLLWSFGNEQK